MLTTPQWIHLASLFIPMLTLVGIIWIWGRIRSFRSERSPITDKLLRPPRESLRREIEKMDEQINDVFIWTFFGPAIATAFFIVATPSLKPLGDSVILVVPFFATVAIVFSLLVWKLIHLIKRRRAYRLGFVGERAVAEELNQLMLEGCHVFHDVPMEPYGNVDHVIVARTDIYAVETKTAAKKKGQ
jgi:hypothetical protein